MLTSCMARRAEVAVPVVELCLATMQQHFLESLAQVMLTYSFNFLFKATLSKQCVISVPLIVLYKG
jgi:hypothetical protein